MGRTQPADRRAGRAVPTPRPGDRDGVPGPDDLAQPGRADRRPGHGGDQEAREGRPQGGPGPGRGAPDEGRHPRPGPPAAGVPPPAVRRDAPAGADRDRDRLRAQAAHRRRAHHRARRDDPGPGPRGAQGARGRHQRRAAPDHPRPGVVAGICDEVNVMYSGRIVESTTRNRLFATPRHPYTGGLLESIPRLDSPRGAPLRPIPGSPTQTIPWTEGCAFAPRCGNRIADCTSWPPPLEFEGDRDLRCYNPLSDPARAERCRHERVGLRAGPQGALPDPLRDRAQPPGRRGQGGRRRRPGDRGGQDPRPGGGVRLRQVDAGPGPAAPVPGRPRGR